MLMYLFTYMPIHTCSGPLKHIHSATHYGLQGNSISQIEVGLIEVLLCWDKTPGSAQHCTEENHLIIVECESHPF